MGISMDKYLDKIYEDKEVNITYRQNYDNKGNKEYWKQFNKSMRRYADEEMGMRLVDFLTHCDEYDKGNDVFYKWE